MFVHCAGYPAPRPVAPRSVDLRFLRLPSIWTPDSGNRTPHLAPFKKGRGGALPLICLIRLIRPISLIRLIRSKFTYSPPQICTCQKKVLSLHLFVLSPRVIHGIFTGYSRVIHPLLS